MNSASRRLEGQSRRSRARLEWPYRDLRTVWHPDSGWTLVSRTDERLVPSQQLLRSLGDSVEAGAGGSYLLLGESLELLRALGHSPGGRLKRAAQLIYIDPPFNTGTQFEHFDDSLDEDTWLSMFRDCIEEAVNILDPEGSFWVHLDDQHQHRARCIMDEILGSGAFVATVAWQKRTTRDSRRAFSSSHDYIHVYSPVGPIEWKKRRNPLPNAGVGANPDSDPRGPWRSAPMSVQDGHATPAQFYVITTPSGARHSPPPGRCWTYSEQKFAALVDDGRIYWPRGGAGKPRLKTFVSEAQGLAPETLWAARDVGTNAEAKKALATLAPNARLFDTPKPLRLLERIVSIATNPGDLVVDFFLGSGTTAVAAHRLGRRWVGIEQSRLTLETFALPWLREEGAEFSYRQFTVG